MLNDQFDYFENRAFIFTANDKIVKLVKALLSNVLL